jgi:hypothetical protein
MWSPKIQTKGQEVYATGTVVSYGRNPLDFYPLPPPFDMFRVEVQFIVDPTKPSGSSVSVIDPNHVRVTLNNFESSLGAATSTPAYVANYAARKIWLSLACYILGTGDTATRVIHYTFSDGGPAIG